ncbi:50S ribosomal protein L15 [Candidatus Peregrinibacteria bacterium]|nr:50S ribosomal protein L15 [Candidatus Peregrinibacteria bacterium]
MQLHSLKPKIGAAKRPRRQVGRGNGSGRGTFCGRGCKGQGQHSTPVRPGFEGGQTPLIRRLPKLKGFKSPTKILYQVVNIQALNKYSGGQEVNFQTLFEHGLINQKETPVKILGTGSLDKPLTVRVHRISQTAKKKIIAAGGKVL